MKTILTTARRIAKSHSLLHACAMPAVRAARRISPPEYVSLARSLVQLFKVVEAGSLIVSLLDVFGSFEIDCRSDVLKRIMIHGQYDSGRRA